MEQLANKQVSRRPGDLDGGDGEWPADDNADPQEVDVATEIENKKYMA